MRHTPTRLLTAVALIALMLGGGTAFADSQPTQVSNSEGRPEPDPLTPGPHCHVVQAGGGQGFTEIITATRHQAHVATNNALGPNAVFAATDCP